MQTKAKIKKKRVKQIKHKRRKKSFHYCGRIESEFLIILVKLFKFFINFTTDFPRKNEKFSKDVVVLFQRT